MNIMIISDLHLGKQNKTTKLISNLLQYLQDNNSRANHIDMFVITGDVFHQLLGSNSEAYIQIVSFFVYLVSWCKRHKIILRTLEGTPSHDNKQMIAIATHIKGLSTDIDYRHVDTLEIEYFKQFDKNCLYLPDKYKDSGEEIQDAISDLLIDNHIAKVDLIFAHGNFNYQLPVKTKSGLDEDFFLSICRYYIAIGHIHNRSVWKQIIALGSFDRLEVNQEIEKGGLYLKIGKTLEDSEYSFIPNNNAMRYDTIDLRDMDVKIAYRALTTHIKSNSISTDDHLRLRTSNMSIYTELKSRLIDDGYNCRIERFTEKAKVNKTVIEVKNTSITITKDNIFILLMKRSGISSLTKQQQDRIAELIKEKL